MSERPAYCMFTPCDESKCGCKGWSTRTATQAMDRRNEDALSAVQRLRNGGQPELASKVELALSFAYADGRRDERAAIAEDGPPCPHCGGGGSITFAEHNGPDAFLIDADCDHCGGKGTAIAAYKGVCHLLQVRAESHMHAVGRYLALRDAFKWVMTSTGEGIASSLDNAERELDRLEGKGWRDRR